VTLLGDAAHPTSPYAAYGAGMSIEDGYFLARELQACDGHTPFLQKMIGDDTPAHILEQLNEIEDVPSR
jgi:2-polyprenyl-6-methoxyphenol hydroxylase-like FAD-dependent oxidoreductase